MCCVASAIADELEPLKSYLTARKDWGNDYTESAYVGTRCAALFFVVGTYYNDNGVKKEDFEQGKKFLDMGKVFRDPTFIISLTINKMSNEAMLARYKLLLETYGEKMKVNKRLHNNAFVDYVYDDMEVCNSIYPSYQKLDKKFRVNNKTY
jgi:hypothetical protein